jgi:hypothetical protein
VAETGRDAYVVSVGIIALLRSRAVPDIGPLRGAFPITEHKTTGWSWQVAMGIPIAFYAVAVGLAMSGGAYFWPGIIIGYVATVVLAVSLWVESKYWSLGERFSGLSAIVGLFGIISWIALLPAPLAISIIREPGNYMTNSDVDGIKWQDAFSGVRVRLSNRGNYDYKNINVTIQTDLLVWQIGTKGPFTKCKMAPFSSTTFAVDMLDNTGKKRTIISKPSIASKKVKIYCDALLSQTDVEFVLALVNFNHAPSPGAPMFLARVEPKWTAVSVDFEANGRPRMADAHECFNGEEKCYDMLKDNGNGTAVGIISIP